MKCVGCRCIAPRWGRLCPCCGARAPVETAKCVTCREAGTLLNMILTPDGPVHDICRSRLVARLEKREP